MKDAAPQTIYLSDYRPFGYHVDDVHLTFRLVGDATRVISRIMFRPNTDFPGEFFLHGEQVKLIWAKIDGVEVTPAITENGLTCDAPDRAFIWEAEVEISPITNTTLDGLYMSNGMYCTQCEAEGFRKITFYPDRPDVMSVFTVRVIGDLPVLLSNGNRVASGDGWAEWHDPWPKPAYLFALVAGDLVAHSGSFSTMSGKDISLNIYVRPGPDEGKCAFAMEALKRSMKWDEDVYGREYDLDVFNIVAVDDFNMGAMENKGLNVFNASYVLASPATATDTDYGWIDAVIAHEYFHNWTGNRITCRDWFQLCLKEGLTVFRDQQYTGDQGSPTVKRIVDAIKMRSSQFREDSGPLAHPVRPESFIEINNFYTLTVYEKGAEIIGMLKTILGANDYYAGIQRYFDRFDGQAVTIEDFFACFDENEYRLDGFENWWSQAGTPRVTIAEHWNGTTLTLTARQMTRPTPGQTNKIPLLIPIATGVIAPSGKEIAGTEILSLTQAEQSWSMRPDARAPHWKAWSGPPADQLPDGAQHDKPHVSLLRNFSAPVILERDQSDAERAFLMAHDTDPFNKWDAGRALARDVLSAMVTQDAAPSTAYLDGIAAILRDDTLDPAFRALALSLPSEDDMAQALFDAGLTPDPLAIHHASEALKVAMAQHVQDILPRVMAASEVQGPYSPDAKSAGKRSLGLAALGLVTRLDGGAAAAKTYAEADNMTMQLGGLAALLRIGKGDDQSAAFRDQWRDDRLVSDKWFALAVSMAPPEKAAMVADALTKEPDFDMKNPNRFRAVFGALAANSAGFHDASGDAYRLLGAWLIKLDTINPQTTARMTASFGTWRRYSETRQAQMREVLHEIAATSGLSRDTGEMVARMLKDTPS